MANPLFNTTNYNIDYSMFDSYAIDFINMEMERVIYNTKPKALDLADLVVDTYIHKVYQVDYINEIFKILDENVQFFTFCKSFSEKEDTPKYHMVINEKLTIRVASVENLFKIEAVSFKIDNKDKIFYLDMVPEAQEKIESKYIQYISRLEDKFNRCIHDIIDIE